MYSKTKGVFIMGDKSPKNREKKKKRAEKKKASGSTPVMPVTLTEAGSIIKKPKN
jgi:hypothetical protein